MASRLFDDQIAMSNCVSVRRNDQPATGLVAQRRHNGFYLRNVMDRRKGRLDRKLWGGCLG
jgi:hypothetical protein